MSVISRTAFAILVSSHSLERLLVLERHVYHRKYHPHQQNHEANDVRAGAVRHRRLDRVHFDGFLTLIGANSISNPLLGLTTLFV